LWARCARRRKRRHETQLDRSLGPSCCTPPCGKTHTSTRTLSAFHNTWHPRPSRNLAPSSAAAGREHRVQAPLSSTLQARSGQASTVLQIVGTVRTRSLCTCQPSFDSSLHRFRPAVLPYNKAEAPAAGLLQNRESELEAIVTCQLLRPAGQALRRILTSYVPTATPAGTTSIHAYTPQPGRAAPALADISETPSLPPVDRSQPLCAQSPRRTRHLLERPSKRSVPPSALAARRP